MWQFLVAGIKEFILALEADVVLFPAGMKLHLYVNNVSPTQASVIADFTELTSGEVPGYAAQSPAWLATPFRNQDQSWSDYQTPVDFIAATAPPSPQVVYGWFLTNSAGTGLVAAGLLANPFTFADAGDGFALEGMINAKQITSSGYLTLLNYLQQ